MVRQRLLVIVLVSLLVISHAMTPVFATGNNIDKPNEFVGPGKHETELYLRNQTNENELVYAGKVMMWNTREEFIICIETTEDWQISETRVFVGNGPIPLSTGNTPKIGQFPYRDNLKTPVESYELKLNLKDDLNFAWGNRKAGEHIQNVSVYAKLINQDTVDEKKAVHEEAWAYGENEFENRGGWWTKYALSKPQTGHFIDSPVAGVKYVTGSQKGKTNLSGAFEYIDGEIISLSLGSLHLGNAVAKHKVSILDLAETDNLDDTRVINMARLLQSLDEDSDPKRGISITEPIINCLETAMDETDIVELDFNDTGMVNGLIDKTKDICSEKGIELTVVSEEEAVENLEDGLTSVIFRKDVSKTPEAETAKAKIELMPVYVPAQKANGDPAQLVYKDAEGNIKSTRSEAKPIIIVYADEIPGTDGAMDVFGAISRDEGNSWKVTNLSRSADKSSFKLENGYKFPGDVLKPNLKVQGNKILAVWTSRYARSGKPTYSISLEDDYPYDDEYYEEDIWGVSGSQKSTDYAELDFPEVGELPYHCVWNCRGVISPETGEITWFKPERLSSGRRDAYQIMLNAANSAGFALVWQEDPEGVRPGEMAGPGHGWSGATTNHKTDVWYSYIKWDDFDKIDENFVSGGDPQHDEDKELTGRPKALVPFSLPVRISDNDTLNSDSMKLMVDENGPVKDEEGNWIVDSTLVNGDRKKDSESSTSGNDSGNGQSENDSEKGYSSGSHNYGLAIPGLCEDFYKKINNQGEEKWVAITADGRLLDGDTGASRPNIMMQPYLVTKPTGETYYDAYVAVCYEETKGVGSGPPDDITEEEDISILSKDGSEDNDGSGDKKGADRYYPDKGKNVIYHSFTLTNPDLVSGGTIINPVVTDENGDIVYLKDKEGNDLLDWNGKKIPAYENARRPRLLIQSKKNALAGLLPGEDATVMVTVFKMGEEGKGRPSDIFMRRWIVVNDATHKSYKGNPYRPENLDDECQNISSVTPTDTWINTDSQSQGKDEDKESIKVIRWEQTEDNLTDSSWTNGYDDARAHRGFIKGNFLAIAYDWTPNWAAARNGNDIYNLYIRRSFDGGATWTTDPKGEGVTHTDEFKIYPDEEALSDDDSKGHKEKEVIETYYEPGEFEPARNCSQIPNTKETVIEPRLVGVPGTIQTEVNGVLKPKYPEDKQSTNAFWITYGTHSNPGRKSEEEGVPLDLYYSYSTDYGETLKTITKTIKGDSNNAGEVVEVWDWLAKDTGKKESEQAECQIRMTPDGSVLYAVWNDTGEDGSDAIFRRIMRDGGTIELIETVEDVTGPAINISGIHDGDVTNGDVIIDITLNEEGTWSAQLCKDGIETVELGLNDVAYKISADNSEHTYLLSVEAQDIAGNVSTKYISFTIDGRLPVISVEGVVDGEITNEDKIISISATGSETVITLSKDGETVVFNSGDTINQDGVYILSIISTNTDYNFTSTKTIDFTIDKIPPVIAVDGVADDSSYNKTVTPIITVTDNHSAEENMTIETLLNSNEFVSGTPLKDNGVYALVITAQDEAENISTLEFNFTIKRSSSETSGKSDSGSSEPESGISENITHNNDAEITTDDNRLKITIPASAITGDATVSVTKTDEDAETFTGIKVGNLVYTIEVKDKNGDNITQFNKDLFIEFYYEDEDIPDGFNEEDLNICYWDEEIREWIVIPSEINIAGNKITALTDHLTIYGVFAIQGFPCLGDIKGHWSEREAYRVVSLNIASGDMNGNLRPEDKITREEFAKLIVLAMGLQPKSEPNLSFSDSDSVSSWAKGYVSAAVNAGFIQGYEDMSFRPKQYISRVEIATAIIRALNMQTEQQSSLSFYDVKDIPEWGIPYVTKAVEKGIISGYSDGTFKAYNNATRAQAFVMISRMLNVK